MRSLKLLSLLALLTFLAYSCTPSDEEGDPSPDYSTLITGTYAYTTYKNGTNTGSGTAIIAKETNSKIRIGLADGVSFYANKLQKIDNDMVMEVPAQDVDYYNMNARFTGQRTIDRAGSMYHGVFFGSKGEMKVSLQIGVNGKTDQVLLVLKR